MYIFDWEENSEKIFETGRYTTRRTQFIEHVAFFKYLMNQGKTDTEIFAIWLGTDSKILQKIGYNTKEANKAFRKIIRQAKEWKPDEYISPIKIYAEEIEILNQTIAPPWLKNYMLAILCFYKFYGKEWVKFKQEIRQTLFYYVGLKEHRERPEQTILIREFLKKTNFYEMRMMNESLVLRVNYARQDGEVVAEIKNPSHVEEIHDILKYEKVCKICGQPFAYNTFSICNEICPDCYKRQRHQKQYACKKKRDGARQQAFPVDCVNEKE